MSALADVVIINRRFARSARLDRDLGSSHSLAGYVLQASVAKSLSAMARVQTETGQGAFTWTGPYGSGKSCAAILLANLVAGAAENRAIAQEIAGRELSELVAEAFPERRGRWAVVAVTGSRIGLRDVIAAAAHEALGWNARILKAALASDRALLDALEAAATRETAGGTLLILDELGKLLEHAALRNGDVQLLQDLAERATRSDGRLVVFGILHQAFERYAAKGERDARREWAKVQGRFQDVPFVSGPDETVSLLGRAISCPRRPLDAAVAAAAVAAEIARRRPTDERALAEALEGTWPLNPVTALLLGSVSRQRFAQNERSVFGFLDSSEPAGFQEHLLSTPAKNARTYDPDRLWDYLTANVGMALSGGADGARFSLAYETIERAAVMGSALHVALVKSVVMIEFFRNGSGLAATDGVLALCVPRHDTEEIAAAIDDLVDRSVLTRRSRSGGYALFAGSDFDLEEALARSIVPASRDELEALPRKLGVGAIVAKRHYLRTGALRTFEVVLHIVEPGETDAAAALRLAARQRRGSGALILLVGDTTSSATEVEGRPARLVRALREAAVVGAVGATPRLDDLRPRAAELLAIERIMRNHPGIEGDRIARREISARHSATVNAMRYVLETALGEAGWYLAGSEVAVARSPQVVASALADAAFALCPVLQSELLQRDRPSSSAMAAVRNLCHAMVAKPGEPKLGFTGCPAEVGLYMTVLEPFGLHRAIDGHFDFHAPLGSGVGVTLAPAWSVFEATDVRLGEVYRTWAAPPYGIKAGVMPVLALASLMAQRDAIAIYCDGVFQTNLDDVLVDKLLQRPEAIRVRRIARSCREAAYLEALAAALGLPAGAHALPIARALYRRMEMLPRFSQRTAHLPTDARAVRDAVLGCADPEDLLFERIPAVLDGKLAASSVLEAVISCEKVYDAMLGGLLQALSHNLGTDASSFQGLGQRVANVQNLTNDYAFEAFAMRAAAFECGKGDLEGLASLLLHKPPQSWSDRDADQALLEIVALCGRFREIEALALVLGRDPGAEAIALVVGLGPSEPPTMRTFVLTEGEQGAAALLADRIVAFLSEGGPADAVRLGALARALASIPVSASVGSEGARRRTSRERVAA